MRKKPRPSTIISKGRDVTIPKVIHKSSGGLNLRYLVKIGALSPFKKKVYRAVSTIPEGETRSYKWVAEKIGRPRAHRAVGNALNKNPYPGIIPCHRVIKSDGSIGGFSKGTKAKKSLLLKEQ